jgi:hypothetical protein
VIRLLLLTVSLLVPSVSTVDARAEHGDQQDDRHGQSDEAHEGHAWTLDAIGPGGLADLVTP